MDTNGIEYTTQHDYRPTHRDPLHDLRQKMVEDWATHAALVDKYHDGIITDRAIVDAAREIAIASDRAYIQAYNKLNAPAAECTCNERHTCAECADKANQTAANVAETELDF